MLAEYVTRDTDIPHGPMKLDYVSTGLLPEVGLHRRGHVFYQQSSYWHLWLSIPFPLAAMVIAFLPLDTYTRCVWAGFCVFMGICGAVPFFVRNHFGQTVIIDPQNQTLCIRKQAAEKTIAWSDVVALQMCQQGKPLEGYQLNLIWRRPDGTPERHCLTNHVIKRFVVRLARSYESVFSFKVIDEVSHRQPAA